MFRLNQFFPNRGLRSSDNWHESQVEACLLKMKIPGPQPTESVSESDKSANSSCFVYISEFEIHWAR